MCGYQRTNICVSIGLAGTSYRKSCRKSKMIQSLQSQHEDDIKGQSKISMVWLHFVGHEGNTCSNQWGVFMISKGLCKLAHDCVVTVFNKRWNDYIFGWCRGEKRDSTKNWLNLSSIHCPMMKDGTLLHLFHTPESEAEADYHWRKFLCSLTVNV